MPKPKVVILGKLPPPYIGPAIATDIILNSALNSSFELIHVDTSINKSVKEFGKKDFSKLGKSIIVYKTLFKTLKTNSIDLVHIPISQTTLGFLKDSIFILIAALFKTKVVIQLRGGNFKNWLNTSSPITRYYLRFCLARTQGVMVLGNNLKHLFENYFQETQIHVVPNGCDLAIQKPAKQDNNTTVQLLYFSNLLESKGIKEILNSLIILKNKGLTNFSLTAVGAWYDTDFRDKCLGLVNQNKLSVTFHKPCSGSLKWKFFSDADIFVFTPNQPEGHPWSIIEALAARLPIISTNQGAIVESVIDGKNGYIVDNKSPKQIAEKLEKLIFDEALRNKMGSESLIHYRENFTEKCMVKNLTKTYTQLIR